MGQGCKYGGYDRVLRKSCIGINVFLAVETAYLHSCVPEELM